MNEKRVNEPRVIFSLRQDSEDSWNLRIEFTDYQKEKLVERLQEFAQQLSNYTNLQQ